MVTAATLDITQSYVTTNARILESCCYVYLIPGTRPEPWDTLVDAMRSVTIQV